MDAVTHQHLDQFARGKTLFFGFGGQKLLAAIVLNIGSRDRKIVGGHVLCLQIGQGRGAACIKESAHGIFAGEDIVMDARKGADTVDPLLGAVQQGGHGGDLAHLFGGADVIVRRVVRTFEHAVDHRVDHRDDIADP